MPTILSPGVYFTETDLTTNTPGVSASTGAFAGEFVWGPTNSITQISNEPALVSRFGKPSSSTYKSFFAAKNFLDYSNNLKVVRVATTGQKNSVTTGTAVTIGNQTVYDASFSAGEAAVGMFAAKYPGVIGDSIKVSMADATTFSRTLTGTIAVAASSNILTGTLTTFDTELTVGSIVQLTVGGSVVSKKVTGVTSATSATVDSNYSTLGTGLTGTALWEYADLFSAAPVASNKAVSMNTTNDGLHMVVVDEDGKFSGTAGTVLETYDNVSKASDAMRYDGTSGYYRNILNSSSYVWWMDHPETTDVGLSGVAFGAAVPANSAYVSLVKPISRSLTGGLDGAAATDGEIQLAFDLFKNKDTVDVSLIFTGLVSTDVSRYVVQNVAEYRQDAIAFVSPVDVTTGAPIIGDTSESQDKIVAWYDAMNVSSSYGFCETGVKYQYDKYNDVYRWIAMNADIAGLCARTDDVTEAWYSPAGLNRGQIKNVTRLAYNPDKASRDELFKRNINPIVAFPGEGTVLYGDKTMLRRPSAFDAIGVRRLFISLEKAIAAASKYYLFEQNTELTRQLFAGTITPLLRDVKGRQGITDFYVDIGSNVNTPATIDAGELRANIFIKPVRSIRFIRLNFIATRTGATFTEIEL